MLVTTPAIVLNRKRFRENRLLVNFYTATSGPETAVFYQGKKKQRTSLLEPLSVVEVILEKKPNRELHTIKEIRLISPLVNIRTDIRKSAISMFLAEVIYLCTRTEKEENKLFRFISEEIQELELEEDPNSFPARFLVKLFVKLGIGPVPASGSGPFPLSERSGEEMNGFQWPDPESAQIREILEKGKTKGNQKNLLNLLLEYLSFQLNQRFELKSKEVLAEVFS